MTTFQEMLSSRKREWQAAALLLLLSLTMVFTGFRFYRRYRDQVIATEESQLLTMAGIIGNNLNTYLEEQLDEIDLFYAPETEADTAEIDKTLARKTPYFLAENQALYNWIRITEPDGCCMQYTPDGIALQAETVEPTTKTETTTTQLSQYSSARIIGKEISDKTGWYELYIQKDLTFGSDVYTLTFAMNLETLYQKIVAPVKIGTGGYSSVKDQDMYIIMHHAKDQIGLEALDDRSKKYPELDLESMKEWLKKQTADASGSGVIDTYVWDDPALTKVQRVVAFQSIYIQGERWIVNSTMPIQDLSGPLDSMMRMLSAAMFLYVLLLIIITVTLLRNRFLAETQQKEIAHLKALNQGMEMLAQKNNEIRHYQRIQSLGMMASHIAHEFNNYLTPVLIYADLLENDADISAENQEMIHEISASVDKAANLSRELLAFSRQDTGVRLEILNFTEEVENAVSIVQQLAPSAITVEATLPQEACYILGRKRMAEHILLNLSKNAFQAMEKSEEKNLCIHMEILNEDTLRLAVSDTGCGISDDALERIFEPFYTTKGSRQGTGLGLSVVQNMVSSVGGSIRVESKPNQGSTFILDIPQSPSADAEDSRKRLHPVEKIAIVSEKKRKDSFPKNKRQLDAYVHPAALINQFRKNPRAYDLVIAEYTLPTMNGIDLCEVIRRINPEIRLILIAEQNSADFEWYLNNGMIDRFMLTADFEKEFPDMFR